MHVRKNTLHGQNTSVRLIAACVQVITHIYDFVQSLMRNLGKVRYPQLNIVPY